MVSIKYFGADLNFHVARDEYHIYKIQSLPYKDEKENTILLFLFQVLLIIRFPQLLICV